MTSVASSAISVSRTFFGQAVQRGAPETTSRSRRPLAVRAAAQGAPKYPAPWHTSGSFMISIPSEAPQLIPPHVKRDPLLKYVSGNGTLALVQYLQSPVQDTQGRYDELAVSPGKFKLVGDPDSLTHPHISQMYVTSEESVQAGRYNWGMPKKKVTSVWKVEPGPVGVGQILNVSMTLPESKSPFFTAEVWLIKVPGVRVKPEDMPESDRVILQKAPCAGHYFKNRVTLSGDMYLASMSKLWTDGKELAPADELVVPKRFMGRDWRVGVAFGDFDFFLEKPQVITIPPK